MAWYNIRFSLDSLGHHEEAIMAYAKSTKIKFSDNMAVDSSD
jgi:hypothetical protein